LTTNKQSTNTENELEETYENNGKTTKAKIEPFISLMDLKRLEAFSNNMIEFGMIRDLVPTISN